MEDTTNYLYINENYIIGLYNLEITTYSDDNIDSYASITGTDQTDLETIPLIPTVFNILHNTSLLISDNIENSDMLSSDDINAILSSDGIFIIGQSGLTITNIDLKTEHSSIFLEYYFFK